MATLPAIFTSGYVQQQQVESLRRQAKDQNDSRLALYTQASNDWITANLHGRDNGLAITPRPTPPKQILVSDQGNWAEEPWAGLPVPELPAPIAPSSNSLRPDPAKVPADRIDQVIQALGVVYQAVKSLDVAVAEVKRLVSIPK